VVGAQWGRRVFGLSGKVRGLRVQQVLLGSPSGEAFASGWGARALQRKGLRAKRKALRAGLCGARLRHLYFAWQASEPCGQGSGPATPSSELGRCPKKRRAARPHHSATRVQKAKRKAKSLADQPFASLPATAVVVVGADGWPWGCACGVPRSAAARWTCAEHMLRSSDWPQLFELRGLRPRSEFCDPTLPRASQGSHRQGR
jgi:hypothetical protein